MNLLGKKMVIDASLPDFKIKLAAKMVCLRNILLRFLKLIKIELDSHDIFRPLLRAFRIYMFCSKPKHSYGTRFENFN